MAFEHSDWLAPSVVTLNSEAIVTAQTALSSNYIAFPKTMAENQTEVNYLCKLYS
jgi:hypothetical protein